MPGGTCAGAEVFLAEFVAEFTALHCTASWFRV